MAQTAHRSAWRLSEQAAAQLLSYAWPGNVRELENVMQRAVILAENDEIASEHLLLRSNNSSMTVKTLTKTADEEAVIRVTPPEAEIPQNMRSLEKVHILETLKAVQGVRKLAAEKLGISERTLRYKLQRYRVEDGMSTAEAQQEE